MDQQTIAQENRCHRCGGQMWFDPEVQALVCTSCKEGAELPEADTAFNCPNCGAELTLITGSRQAKCDFCDGTFTMLQEGESCEITGEIPDNHKYIIPFTVDEEAYRKGMISWLANERLTPTDAFDKIAIIKSEGRYIPYYYCIANFKGKYTASIGYDRIETYVDHVRQKDSRGNIRTVPVTRTRTVTDWHPYQAAISGTSNNLCEASYAIQETQTKTNGANPQKVLAEIANSSHGLFEPLGIQIDRKHPFDTKYTAGYAILPCDEPVSKVYDKEKIHKDIHRIIKEAAPGDRIRDIRFQGDIIPDYFLVYRPNWSTVYSYGDAICYNNCEGINDKRHYGTRPICKDLKQLIFKWTVASIVSGLIFVVLLGLTLGGNAPVGFVFAGILAAMAAIFCGVKLALAFRIARMGTQINIEKSKRYLENPSTLFGRKSAKADPTK